MEAASTCEPIKNFDVQLNIIILARSPLVGHINSSLEGLTTIRAFRAEQILKDEFDKHQDLYTSVFMTLKISMLGFGFFMNLFSTVFTIIIIAHFLFFDTGKIVWITVLGVCKSHILTNSKVDLSMF